MLFEQCVPKELLNLLRDLQSSTLFKEYFLVGGTSLTLQLGHRLSYDIDLFTQNEMDKRSIKEFLFDTYKGNIEILNEQNIVFQVLINGIKVDFVKERGILVEPVIYESGIAYLGKKDIAAMKLNAIETNGTRAKDFVDLYYLFKEIPLKNMFEYYRKKYKVNNIFNAKRSIVYFDDVKNDDWENVQLIKDTLSVNEIKKRIIDEVRIYDKKYVNVNIQKKNLYGD
jgi:hypothetical protein